MGLVDYISRNPYQPAKSVSKFDEEFLVATLSSIHSDAQLLQRKHNLLAHSLNKSYIDIDDENKNSTTNTEQVLTIDYVKPNPNPQTKIYESFAPRNNSLKLCSKQTSNFDINSAQRVRLTIVSSNLAARKYNSNVTSLKFNHQYSKAQADRKTVSMLYLSLGTEGRRIVCSQNPHLKMDSLSTAELWTIMEAAFIRQRNITFDRYVLLTTKQTRGESIEHFFGKLKELSENCELGSQEDTLIRDLFIANMLDPEIQRELLRETIEPAQALRLAINMELGQRNQLQITNSKSAPQINAVIPQRSFRPPNQRPTTSSFTRSPNELCRNSGLTWSANHKVKCFARGKTCNICGLQNHFSRVCRKLKSSSNKPIRSNVNSVEETSTDQTINAIQNMNYNPQCESDYDSSDDNVVASIASNAIQIEPKNTILQIGNTHAEFLIDSGSVCSILQESLASEIVENSPLARWVMISPPQELKTFSNEPINVTYDTGTNCEQRMAT